MILVTSNLDARALWVADVVHILEALGADKAWLFADSLAEEFFPAYSPDAAVEDALDL